MIAISRDLPGVEDGGDEVARSLLALVSTASRGAAVGYSHAPASFGAAGRQRKGAKGRAVTTWGKLVACLKALPHALAANGNQVEDDVSLILFSVGSRSSLLHGAPPDGATIVDYLHAIGATIHAIDVAFELEGRDPSAASLFAVRRVLRSV